MSTRGMITVAMAFAMVAAVLAGCSAPERGDAGGTQTVVSTGAGPAGTDAGAPEALAYPEGYECVFNADCGWQQEAATKEMNSALSTQPEIHVVFGHNDPSAYGAYLAAQQEGEGREEQIKFIGIDGLAHEGMNYVRQGSLDVTFYYPSGGPEAIKAAVRILGGEKVAQNIALGTKLITAENVDSGGEEMPPDEMPGWETADVLDEGDLPQLSGDQYLIGMSQCNLAEPWRKQMDADIAAAAADHPELKVLFKDAQGKAETQQAHVREFIDQGVDLIIISPLEAQPLTEPVEEAMKEGIPVIVLDRKIASDNYTCYIGGANVKMGREAGKWVRRQFPEGCKIVELTGLMTSTPAQERHEGFLLGLNTPDSELGTEAPAVEPAEPEAPAEPTEDDAAVEPDANAAATLTEEAPAEEAATE